MSALLITALPPALRALIPASPATALDLSSENLSPALQAKLRALEPVLVAVHETRPAILAAWAVLAAAVLLAALFAAMRGGIGRPAPWRYALLGVLSFPAASTLMFVMDPEPKTSRAVVMALIGAWALLWGLSMVAAGAGGPRRALGGLLLGTAALVLVDQWLGGPWSFTGILGYSPIDGVRYYGLGNEGAAVLFGASLIGAGLTVDGCPPGGRRDLLGQLCLPLLGAVVVLTAAAPTLGANITVAVWGTAGFAVAAVLATGRRVGWREAGMALLVAILLVVALSVYDLSRPDGGTHLARTLRAVGEEGLGALTPLVTHKLAMNWRMLTSTPASLLVLAGMGWLARVLARPTTRVRAMLAPRPTLTASMWGALAGSALALVTEDSGIIIPALVLLFACGTLAYVGTLGAPALGAVTPAEDGASREPIGAGGVGE